MFILAHSDKHLACRVMVDYINFSIFSASLTDFVNIPAGGVLYVLLIINFQMLCLLDFSCLSGMHSFSNFSASFRSPKYLGIEPNAINPPIGFS